MKKELTKLDLDSYEFSKEAKKYLGDNKVKAIYKDNGSSNWDMAELEAGYFVFLSKDDNSGCKSGVFGSIAHTKSIFNY